MSPSFPAPAPLRLIQLTDSHLGSQPGAQLLSMDTDHSLGEVVARVRREQPLADLLLATGDLADSGADSAYRRFLTLTDGLARHTRCLPGNHDAAARLYALLAGDERGARITLLENWLIVALNTAVPGEVGGFLADSELALLTDALRRYPQRHALVALHHPVLPVGTAWIDPQRVANADAFWAAVAPFKQLRAVVGGHVHMETDSLHNGVRVLTSPSTCIQFAPGSDDFRLDTLSPGYRWLDLHADGRLDTGVSRVSGVRFTVDMAASGY